MTSPTSDAPTTDPQGGAEQVSARATVSAAADRALATAVAAVRKRPDAVPTIAVVGLEGSGKTVLACTLAHRLSKPNDSGVIMSPVGARTLTYVERIWATLKSGEWPESTPPGTLAELRWQMVIHGHSACEIRLADVAGQDLRQIFGDDQHEREEALSPEQRSLIAFCRSADIVLFLLNLRDYIGQSNTDLAIANQAAMKSAIDHLRSGPAPRRVCVVLTQAELYKAEAARGEGWLALVQRATPYLYSAHLADRSVKVFPVSAVHDTVIVQDADGPRRVPAPSFRSAGLYQLVDWIAESVSECAREPIEARGRQRMVLWVVGIIVVAVMFAAFFS